MSLLIINDNKLDANNYFNISISQTQIGNRSDMFCVTVNGEDEKAPMVLLPNKFSDVIKYENDKQKIMSIVNYFLQYTKVSSIVGSTMFEDDFVATGFRSLNINVSDMSLALDIESAVLEKYINDRNNFLESHSDIKIYEFSVKENVSEYSIDENMSLVLNSCGDGELYSYDSKFFSEFLLSKFRDEGEEASFHEGYMPNEKGDGLIEMFNWIRCGQAEFRIQSVELLGLARDVVREYNSLRKEEKIKQIKLEGF